MSVEVIKKPLTILIVDDDDGDRKQIKRVINEVEPSWICAEAGSIDDALMACNNPFDCAIVDYLLPGANGLAGIKIMHQRFPSTAIIMATGKGDEVIATEAMKLGALDYL